MFLGSAFALTIITIDEADKKLADKNYKEAIELCNKCMILIKENNEGKLASIILSDIAYNMLRQIEIKERKSADFLWTKEK